MRHQLNALPAALAIALTGCVAASDAADDGSRRTIGGKADEVPADAACLDLVLDKTEGDDATGLADLSARHDPIAQFVLTTPGACPRTYAELIDTLRAKDTAGCEGPTDGMRTMVVSETAQVLDRPDVYRSVTTRQCGDRPAHALMFSQLGLSADASALPENAEIMAFDQVLDMFAFYTLQDGQWSFHGTSRDLLAQTSQSRCAQCHVDGAMVMKELDTPWVHWEGDATTPGAAELIDQFDDLGTRSDGAELEQIVKDGNARWAEAWIEEALESRDVSRVLRPLFCSQTFNISTAARAATDPVRFIPALALVDDTFDTGPFPLQLNMTSEVYEAAIADAGQRIEVGGAPLLGPDGEVVTDTHFKMAFVHRSRAEQQLVERLTQVGVIDRDFALDVLSIDFTQPLLSADRCALLDFAPDVGALAEPPTDDEAARAVSERFEDVIGNCCEARLEPGCSSESVEACVCASDDFCCAEEWDQLCVRDVTDKGCAACPGREAAFASRLFEVTPGLAEQIRNGFIANLEAAAPAEGTAAATLLARLRESDDQSAHEQRVAEFFDTCNARDPEALMADVLMWVAAQRNAARATPLIEFEATLPVDDLEPAPTVHFDPATCALVQ